MWGGEWRNGNAGTVFFNREGIKGNKDLGNPKTKREAFPIDNPSNFEQREKSLGVKTRSQKSERFPNSPAGTRK